MGFLSKLFRVPDKKLLKERVNNGAMLVDVRTKEEFKAGNVKRSINSNQFSDLVSFSFNVGCGALQSVSFHFW